MNLETEPGTIVKLIINNHQKKSDKLTKISGRDLTIKFTRDIKKVGLSVVIYMYKDFDNCSILKKYRSPSLQICRKHKDNCYNNKRFALKVYK